MKETTDRFSGRVDNYVKYRPGYPEEVFDFLEQEKIISEGFTIADIGCGTGISAKPLLMRGYTVYGIEPNKEMLKAAESVLTDYKNFRSVIAAAEKTTLNDNSVNTIIAGQAFHWFKRDETKIECKRILKQGGQVVLMWNDRHTDSSDFLKVYEDFLQMFGTDYKEVDHKKTQDKKIFNEFFGENNYQEKIFSNFQDVDFAGLKGRVLSSSYMPDEEHRDFEFMIYCLKKIFMRYQEKGTVRLLYDTKIYYGTIKENNLIKDAKQA